MVKNYFLVIISFLFYFNSYCQVNNSYSIDSTIKEKVDENIKLTDFHVKSSMNFTMTLNDSSDLKNLGQEKNLGAITNTFLRHNSVFITSLLMARKATLGYRIILYKNNYTIKFFSLADEDIYKTDSSDKLSYLISVACQTSKLTLLKKPKFHVGETIEGIVEFTSDEYWTVNNKQETKIKTKLTGYFQTNVVQFNPDEKNMFSGIK